MAGQIKKDAAQQIVDTVHDVCGKNINFIDDTGIIIASTDEKRVNTFHEIGKEVVRTGQTMNVMDDKEYDGARRGVNCPISYKGKAIAAIGISGDPEEVRKYAYLAQKISLLLLRERDMDIQERNRNDRMNYILRSLIHGEEMPPGYLEKFLEDYGRSAGKRFCTVVLRVVSEENPDNLYGMEKKIYQVFEQFRSGLYMFDYPNEYVILLSEKELQRKWPVFEKLSAECGKILKIAAGSVERLREQDESYRNAKMVLQSLSGDRTRAMYEELDLELLLGSVPEHVKESYRKKTIDILNEEDREVLCVYFEENLSLIRSAGRLNIHKNTLQYRLDRIYSKCGYNPRVFEDSVILYNALKL